MHAKDAAKLQTVKTLVKVSTSESALRKHNYAIYCNLYGCKIVIWKAQGVPLSINTVYPKHQEVEEEPLQIDIFIVNFLIFT